MADKRPYTGAVRRTWVMAGLPLEEFTREELEETVRKWRKMRDWRFDAMQMRAEAKYWKTLAAALADALLVSCETNPPPGYMIAKEALAAYDAALNNDGNDTALEREG